MIPQTPQTTTKFIELRPTSNFNKITRENRYLNEKRHLNEKYLLYIRNGRPEQFGPNWNVVVSQESLRIGCTVRLEFIHEKEPLEPGKWLPPL